MSTILLILIIGYLLGNVVYLAGEKLYHVY
jgi:hypothetical protein